MTQSHHFAKPHSQRIFCMATAIQNLLLVAVLCYVAFEMFIPNFKNATQTSTYAFILVYIGIFVLPFNVIENISGYCYFEQKIKRLEMNEKDYIFFEVKQQFYKNIASLIITISITIVAFYGFFLLQHLDLESLFAKEDRGLVALTFYAPLMILPLTVVKHFLSLLENFADFKHNCQALNIK